MNGYWVKSADPNEFSRLMGVTPWVLWVRRVPGGWSARAVNRYVPEDVIVFDEIMPDRESFVRSLAEWAALRMWPD